MQPVSHLYHHTPPTPSWCPFHSLTLTLRTVPPPCRHSPYPDWAPEPHASLYPLHVKCPGPAQALTLRAMGAPSSECSWSENLHAGSWSWVCPHSSCLDSDTVRWTGLPRPYQEDVLLFRHWRPRPGGAALWAPSLSCLSYDSRDQAVPSHARMYLPPCSGVDAIQQAVPCRDWPSPSRCTSAPYARLPCMPFHPVQAVTPSMQIVYLTHACLHSPGLSLCWAFPPMSLIFPLLRLWHLDPSSLDPPFTL